MCEFVSWKETREGVIFLTNKDLTPKKFGEYKKYNKGWRRDLPGHGAITYFTGIGEGIQRECTDFSSPDNFPPEIVKAIKEGRLSQIGYNIELLNDEGKAEYQKIDQSALAEYEKIRQSALAESE